jgi:hypothetical protein
MTGRKPTQISAMIRCKRRAEEVVRLLQTLAQQGDTRSCSGPLAGKDFGAQLVVSLIGKPL